MNMCTVSYLQIYYILCYFDFYVLLLSAVDILEIINELKKYYLWHAKNTNTSNTKSEKFSHEDDDGMGEKII